MHITFLGNIGTSKAKNVKRVAQIVPHCQVYSAFFCDNLRAAYAKGGGASVGVMVAYLTGWSLIAASRLPMEVGILGWKLTLIRLACTIIFAPLAGLIANALFSGVRLDTGG